MCKSQILTSLVVARSHRGVIGYKNNLPWKIPEDLRNFKKLTIGKPVIMGRKTFESIGKPLINRTNVVITSQKGWTHEGTEVCHNLNDAIRVGKNIANLTKVNEIFVIGGSRVYAESLVYADRIYLTEIYKEYKGDVWFDNLSDKDWVEISSDCFTFSDKNKPAFSFKIFHKR
ncbi:MAG: dihydrofolate reductase [Pseudomonadota bacterium]|nr:dihydrofolate reductase [Pseudomonadota bacterium]|tara:strand:+ start:67 stop:585 length:519 start_codon:yes stop_codon:yes gene_type:complete